MGQDLSPAGRWLRQSLRTGLVAAAAGTLWATAQPLLLAWAAPRSGATGAAAACTTAIVAMYAAFALLGHRELASTIRTTERRHDF